MNKVLKIAKDIVSDPAFGFNIGGILLFAGTGPIGLAATVGATAAVTGVNILKSINPSFLQKETAFNKFVKDPRAPLWLLTAAMVVVTGASFAAGASAVATLAGAVFAVADFLCAEQLGRALGNKPQQNDVEKPAAQKSLKNNLLTALKLPEPYLAVGLMMSGLMSGGLSTLAFPLVLAGAGICIANTLKKQPEHEGHPKLFYSGAMSVFGAIGLATGNILPGLANIVSAAYMVRLESQLTPGGTRQMLEDVKQSMKKLFNKQTHETTLTAPEYEIVFERTLAPFEPVGKISPEFGKVVAHMPAAGTITPAPAVTNQGLKQ